MAKKNRNQASLKNAVDATLELVAEKTTQEIAEEINAMTEVESTPVEASEASEVESSEVEASEATPVEVAPVSESEADEIIRKALEKQNAKKSHEVAPKNYQFDPITRKFHYTAYCILDMLRHGPMTENQIVVELAKRGQTKQFDFKKSGKYIAEFLEIEIAVMSDKKVALVTSPSLSLFELLDLYNLAWTNCMRKRTGRACQPASAIIKAGIK
jgi:hypothetical protein